MSFLFGKSKATEAKEAEIKRKLQAIDAGFIDLFIEYLEDYFITSGNEYNAVIGEEVPESIVNDLQIPRDKNNSTLLYRKPIQALELDTDYIPPEPEPERVISEDMKKKYSLSTFYEYPENYCHGKQGKERAEAIQLVTAARDSSVKLFSAEHFSREEYGSALDAFFEKMNKILKYCNADHGIKKGFSNALASVGSILTSRDKAKPVTKTQKEWEKESINVGINDQNDLDGIIVQINKVTEEAKQVLIKAVKEIEGFGDDSRSGWNDSFRLNYYATKFVEAMEGSIKILSKLFSERDNIIEALANKQRELFSRTDFYRIRNNYRKDESPYAVVNLQILKMCCRIKDGYNDATLDDEKIEYLKTINVLPETIEKMVKLVPIVMEYRECKEKEKDIEKNISRLQNAAREDNSKKLWDEEEQDYKESLNYYIKKSEEVNEYNELHKGEFEHKTDLMFNDVEPLKRLKSPDEPDRDKYKAYTKENKTLRDYRNSLAEQERMENRKRNELEEKINNCVKEFQRICTASEFKSSGASAGGSRRNRKRMLSRNYNRRGRNSRSTRRHRHRRTNRK